MVGGANDVARDDFATGLMEQLDGPEARDLKPLGIETLEEGVAGFTFDLAPLKKELILSKPALSNQEVSQTLIDLVKISLNPLPTTKPRLVFGATSPHQILHLISQAGIDVFDAWFAQRSADWGVALDFDFPAPPPASQKLQIGANLYEDRYQMDFTSVGGGKPCPCIACSPEWDSSPLLHSSLDAPCHDADTTSQPFTRAYIHHLLHTHEMSAHAMLASHNLYVLQRFFSGIRTSIQSGTFQADVQKFEETYATPDGLFERALAQWVDVDVARGKGRLARERAAKEKALEESTGIVTE